MEPLSAGAVPGKGFRRDNPSDPWSVSVEAIQETSKILITLMGEFPSLSAINGSQL